MPDHIQVILNCYGESVAYLIEYDAEAPEAPTRDCPGSPGGIGLIRLKRDLADAPWVDAGELTPSQWDVVVAAIEERLESIAEAHREAEWERRQESMAEMWGVA